MHDTFKALAASRRAGRTQGIYAVCSAHDWVIEAAMAQALEDGTPLLVEATSNQVDQFGGYTGMTPEAFRDHVLTLADRLGLPRERVLLGGDHLGPNRWQDRPAAEAMALADELLRAYAAAGFVKLHLDASMRCADDPATLDDATVAARAVRLCRVAEAAAGGRPIAYVIGTEVPTPGGATEALDHLTPTTAAAARQTLAVHRAAFEAAGLQDAWRRVIALVVQPGVEFDHTSVVDYQPQAAVALTQLLAEEPNLVFEAHSTDYQNADALAQLVRDGFAILKVGPGLSFALREALYALSAIEAELLPAEQCAQLIATVERTMLASPAQWQHHYHGDAAQQRVLRSFSYSDRVRYYWTEPAILSAVDSLMHNLQTTRIPLNLLSQFMPLQYRAVRAGQIANTPHALVQHHVREALRPYAWACGAPHH